MDERGVVLFQDHHEHGDAPDHPEWALLNACRTRLHDAGLIGATAEGIGYGNVSVRIPGTDRFVISGTQTGETRTLAAGDYTIVLEADISGNRVRSVGPVRASSESMSHSVLYEADSRIGAVMHIHSARLWHECASSEPSTTPGVEAGTPEMAHELGRIARGRRDLPAVIVMAGHADGLIAYGLEPVSISEMLLSFARRFGLVL